MALTPLACPARGLLVDVQLRKPRGQIPASGAALTKPGGDFIPDWLPDNAPSEIHLAVSRSDSRMCQPNLDRSPIVESHATSQPVGPNPSSPSEHSWLRVLPILSEQSWRLERLPRQAGRSLCTKFRRRPAKIEG